MLNNVYEALIRKHPDHLINVSVRYSPGAGKLSPFYYAMASINNVNIYPSPPPDAAKTPDEALEKLLFYINLQ